MEPEATLLVWSSVARLLAGDLSHTVTVPAVQAALTRFPGAWPVVGVGTTDWDGRNGEMMPDGRADALHFWWADPRSRSHAALHDDADPAYVAALGHAVRFPFLALAVGDPAAARTIELGTAPDLHAALTERLAALRLDLAGVQVRGRLGAAHTTDAANLPRAHHELCGAPHLGLRLRAVDYAPGEWVVNGLYAAAPAWQETVSQPDAPLHLHGYQPATMRGGHLHAAPSEAVRITVWPLPQTAVYLPNGAD